MKVIAVNGSPRRNRNTATLLQKAIDGANSIGAETELIHLYDLQFSGCTSCFACKRKSSRFVGHCAMKDDLSDCLEKILKCNVLLLGSPIYLNRITGEMSCFLERLLFPNFSYNVDNQTIFKGKIASGFIYTMNVTEETMKHRSYETIFQQNQQALKVLGGTSEILIANDTYQFDDYSKYEASKYDEKHKAQVRAEQFPTTCQKAFNMGARLSKSCTD
ncbi:flavodoxin family protein [Caproicibacter sp.]|uniref:flavodoxin family protein n=1 Tax=Caproicibacter sp. TaxID=2814884 RepID=UPI0039899F76